MAREGIVPERVDRIVPSLEDVFIHRIEEQAESRRKEEAVP